MKMQEAMDIIHGKPQGFMVHFEWIRGRMLHTDYFPAKHSEEPLIDTEREAWYLAAKFAEKTKGQACNFYVIGNDFKPVEGYRDNIIKNR